MIIPIRCFTCGKVLADKWNFYLKKSEELEREYEKKLKEIYKDESFEEADGSDSKRVRNFEPVKKGAILDELGLNKYCCRRHMLTHIDIIEII